MKAPNGHFWDDMLVYQDMDRRGFAARGYTYEGPDFRNASRSVLLEKKNALRRLLHSLDLTTELKFHWSVDSDYRDMLGAYARKNSECRPGSWEQIIRDEKLCHYTERMQQRQLRRERCRLYIGRRIPVDPPALASGRKLQNHYAAIATEVDSSLRHYEATFASLLAPFGVRLVPMAQADLFNHLHLALNPSVPSRPAFDANLKFDPQATIQENCWNGQISSDSVRAKGEVHFYHDGHYHTILVLRGDRPPDPTDPYLIWNLTDLGCLDYSVTVTVRKLDPEKEKNRMEANLDRLKAEYADEGRESTVTSIDKLKQQVRNIAQGTLTPMEAEFIVHLWAPSIDQLIAKTNQAKTAFDSMRGAQPYHLVESSTVKHLWYNTWPGFCFTPYRHFFFYCEDDWLADLLPLSSSFTGHSAEPEALYEGENKNLIALSTFVDNTPQLATCAGMTRTGKDVFLCDLLTQTSPYFDYTFILEEGKSQGLLSQLNGCDPIVIKADSPYTFNYFDTHGLPLTGLQKAAAAALCAKMVGTLSDEEKQNRRHAQLSQYINALYTDFFEEWERDHVEKIPGLARLAKAVLTYRSKKLPSGTTFVESYVEFRDRMDSLDDEALSVYHAVTEEEISRFLTDPQTHSIVRDCAFASFSPEEYPRHFNLCQMMGRPMREHDPREIRDMATQLKDWTASEGTHGALVDGVRNVSLTGRMVHFELGEIPEASKDLKSVANFLVANDIRQHILSMRRGARKAVYFGETSRTLGISGGSALVSEYYAQLSKFSVWIVNAIQQYSMFKNSPVRPVVMGNSSMFFFFRMNDRADLADLSTDLGLPDVTQNRIMAYPRPQDLPPGKKHSSLTYYHLDAIRPICGTIHNYVSPKMLYVASSTGSEFDQRAQALKQYPTALEGVLSESSKIHSTQKPN